MLLKRQTTLQSWSVFSYFDCPVDAGRKLNVHKTFRRRQGRLLNVLYTFNQRPVSTGWFAKTKTGQNQIRQFKQKLVTRLIICDWFFQEGYFWSKIEKNELHCSFLHILISLFYLKQTILNFWTKFAQKGWSYLKKEKWTSPLNSAYLN